MTWWEYVQRTAGDETQAQIAARIGITGPSVGRWSRGSNPDPDVAARFAREFGRPVLEAFIAANYLTPEEAGEQPSAVPSLTELSHDELLAEVRRRMEGGSDAGQAEAQKNWLALAALPDRDDDDPRDEDRGEL